MCPSANRGPRADVNLKDNSGDLAIHKAKRNDHDDAVKLLLAAGSENTKAPPIPKPPFHIPGYELKPCGTPDQQAEMIRQVEERRKVEEEEAAAEAKAMAEEGPDKWGAAEYPAAA